MPLHSMAIPQSIITITEALFVSVPINTIIGIKSKKQTPRGTKFVSLHEDMPRDDTPPSSLMDSTTSPKMKTTEGKRVGACSLARSTLGVEGRAGAPRWGLGRLISIDLHKTKQQAG